MKPPALLAVIVILLLCLIASLGHAQQPTATVSSLSGIVLVQLPEQDPVAASEGAVLKAGDIIELKPGASAILSLSDGSEVQLGENTRLDIAMLMQSPEGARTSRLKLFYGRLRAFLSGDHQKEGSSFEIETPNAQVGVKFSQPDVEVGYDEEQEITIIRAYTVSVRVLNLVTGAEVKEMPSGHQAEVHNEYIIVTKIAEVAEWIGPEGKTARRKKTTRTRTSLLIEGRFGVMGAISSTPISAAIIEPGSPVTSQIPPPENRTIRPEDRIEPVRFTFTITEE